LDRSRYTDRTTTRLHSRKRTIALPGTGEDSGKWIRCWNCGYIVNVERDMGDTERSGNYEADFPFEALPPSYYGTEPVIVLETLNQVGTVILNGPDGEPITDYYTPRVPLVSHGCPLCGCANV